MREASEDPGRRACPVCGDDAPRRCQVNGFSVHKCIGCGLGYIDPLPEPERLSEYYNDGNFYRTEEIGYPDYSELEPALRRMYLRLVQRLARRHGLSLSGTAVLDVGCAYGFFLDVAKQCGAAELWGTDVTVTAGDMVRSKGHRFVEGAFERVDLPARRFDLVFMGDVVEHLHDPFAAIARVRDVLKPGGMVVMTTVDFDSWFVRLAGRRWRLLIPPIHTYYWTRRSLDRVLRSYGFTGACTGYTLYVPKRYLIRRFGAQFGYTPRFIEVLPLRMVPIRSFDTMRGIYRAPAL
jgi:SAM-dependent methyltransferase